jgi:UDP-galactopyranose mutase
MSRIVILGAGPTGLGAAWRLRETGYEDWAIYERNDHVGGLSASVRDEKGYVWDYGGHIIFSHYEEFDRIVQTLLGDEVVAHQRESWVWLMDRFIKYPFQNNFHFLPEDVTLECVMGLLRAREDDRPLENFEDWIYRSFGAGIAKYFLIPYNRKVWSIQPKEMDFNWIGERVAVVDMERVLSNIIHRREDSTWGPNNEFLFPLHGGTGGLFERFVPHLGDHLHLDCEAVRVDLAGRTVHFADGREDRFDHLLSTMPVDRLVEILDPAPDDEVREAAGRLRWAGGYIVGVGVHAPCPSDKNWMYFPEDDSPFYRVTYLSNYSPNMAPGDDCFSLLCETSHSPDMPESKDDIIERTLKGLKSSRLLTDEDERRVESVQLLDVDYLLPVPFLGRNEVLRTIHRFLEERGIYSRGRFGGWKYEVGNMDHSVMQGIEWARRVVEGAEESVYATGL